MSDPPAAVDHLSQVPAHPTAAGDASPVMPVACANCGATLTGEYCSSCGQHHEPHVHSLGHFASEAFESITHADSRLWRTLWHLLSKPGLLTREFFAGRRASYLPPFRLYLVLSVILVMLSSLATRGEPPAEDATSAKTAAAAPETSASGITTPEDTSSEPGTPALTTPEVPAPDASAAAKPSVDTGDVRRQVIQIDGLDRFCEAFEGADTGEGNYGGRQNILRFCKRIRTEPGELAEAVVHSIPRAMFVFLPLIAALMKLMYWWPRRYYVEHLLFLVHNHAAAFLLYTLVVLYSFIPVINGLTPLVVFIGLGYLAWYVFRAMRAYYGQGWWLTFAKYSLLFWLYVITAIAGFLFTLVLVAILG